MKKIELRDFIQCLGFVRRRNWHYCSFVIFTSQINVRECYCWRKF